MGMGYGACFADTIQDKFLQKTCPTEYKAFLKALKENNFEYDEYSQIRVECNGIDEDSEDQTEAGLQKVDDACDALIKAFHAKFPDAGLSLGHHDADESGDRYDDVNGHYWEIEKAYQLSPVGRMLKEHLSRDFFVTFG